MYPHPPRSLRVVAFPPESERAGLLGQALFLALSAKPDDTSITGRRLFVREQFLCQHVPPAAGGREYESRPFNRGGPSKTNRDRMGDHVANKFCATCHNLIDPIGFGLEKFDAVGGRRDKYELLFAMGYHGDGGGRRQPPKKVELPMDTKGWVAGIANSNFASPRELGALLARTPQCQECMVKQYFRYTAGRMETPADHALIARVLDDFRDSTLPLQRTYNFSNAEP